MDLRSIKPGIAAASQMPLFMVHPKTGEMLTPLGWSKRGAPMWPVMGGAEEDESKDDAKDDDKGEEDESEDDDDEDESEEEDDDSDDEKGKGKNAKAKIKALEEEKDRHFRKAKKFRTRAETAEAELAALKAKYESGDDKDDKDKDKGKDKPVDDSRAKAAEAKAQRLIVENAFLRVNEVSWHKPEQALALMMADDDYEIEFDEDGKVDRKSLRAELKRFAKANPHLVKKPAAKDDDGSGDGDEKDQRSTAPKMNGKRKGKKQEDPASREQLAKTFPALQRMPS